ncbi:MAG: cryptochrome/photolyase family protein, partial [Micrococcales bacterium]
MRNTAQEIWVGSTMTPSAGATTEPQRLIYVAHDHLHSGFGALKNANPQTDAVILVESQRMTTGRNWHPERLFFMLSAARHFAQELQEKGFTVRYLQAATTIDGLNAAKAEFGNLPVVAAQASSHTQLEQLTQYGVKWVANDFFLTSRSDFALWAERQKSFVMENFYRAQRLRLGILVEGGKPVGGQWNFDHDNRLPPPKNYTWPAYLEHVRDEIDQQVAAQLDYQPTSTWATTRQGALAQLEYFVQNHLAGFGPYEDAVTHQNW